jgi:DNA-binding CsgD family transcriptional regulator
MLSINNNNAYDHLGRERQVTELYNQGKSTRDIAKELRMSLRDISIILRKYQVNHGIVITKDNGNDNNNSNRSPNEKASQTYKLFSEGKKPFEVAIELGIREAQVNKFFSEFWKLKNLNELYEIYPQIRHTLSSFLKLHKVLKRKGLTASNVEWFTNAIEIGTIKLPELQGRHKSLQNQNLPPLRFKSHLLQPQQRQHSSRHQRPLNLPLLLLQLQVVAIQPFL